MTWLLNFLMVSSRFFTFFCKALCFSCSSLNWSLSSFSSFTLLSSYYSLSAFDLFWRIVWIYLSFSRWIFSSSISFLISKILVYFSLSLSSSNFTCFWSGTYSFFLSSFSFLKRSTSSWLIFHFFSRSSIFKKDSSDFVVNVLLNVLLFLLKFWFFYCCSILDDSSSFNFILFISEERSLTSSLVELSWVYFIFNIFVFYDIYSFLRLSSLVTRCLSISEWSSNLFLLLSYLYSSIIFSLIF